MTVSSVARLYTPEVLALATSLARWPHDPALPHHGTARSASCGSTLAIALSTDAAARIAGIGLRAQACAIGQASAALFAAHAQGRTRTDIAAAAEDLAAWLGGAGDLPDWPGLAAIAPAAAFPGRHGAIMLPWKAALAALPSPLSPR
jgi:NifU-like protein involved in Fe-S cluster formation